MRAFLVIFSSVILLFSFVKPDGVEPRNVVHKNLSLALKDSANVFQLVLKGQKLAVFPKEIFKFPNLEVLDLSKNKIDSIPTQINQLKKLRILKLGKNKFKHLPAELFQLENLRVLDLNNNEISVLPPAVKGLKSLQNLDIWSTNISVLPSELAEISTLKVIDMRGVALNSDQQQAVMNLFPKVKILFSASCNCSY